MAQTIAATYGTEIRSVVSGAQCPLAGRSPAGLAFHERSVTF